MPIALRLNMADSALPISQWTEAGATRIAPRVRLTRSAFSGCSAMTARIADVSMTISTFTLYQSCTIVQVNLRNGRVVGWPALCGTGRGQSRGDRDPFGKLRAGSSARKNRGLQDDKVCGVSLRP